MTAQSKNPANSPTSHNSAHSTVPANTIEIRVERLISASPGEVFDAWLDPSVPGSPFHNHDQLILDAKVNGLFYWHAGGVAHYGRFVQVDRAMRLAHTWMSRKTLGEETLVTITFHKQGNETLMTLVHSGFAKSGPISGCAGVSDDMAQAHEKGWNAILDHFAQLLRSKTARQQ